MQIALELVAECGLYVLPEAMAGLGEPAQTLSDRQLGVLRQIARAMGISKSTVKRHTSAIFRALGVSSRAEAIVAARRRGVVSD